MQLDPSASYKKRLAQYSLYGLIMAEATKETEVDVVGGSKEEREVSRAREWTRVSLGQESVSDKLLLVGTG